MLQLTLKLFGRRTLKLCLRCLGASGPCKTSVIYGPIPADAYTDFNDVVQKDFAAHHPTMQCRDQINIAGLSWLNSSKKVLLLAEVPPSPECNPDAGYFDAYVVSVRAGNILGRYTMKQAAKRWKKILGDIPLNDLEYVREHAKTKLNSK